MTFEDLLDQRIRLTMHQVLDERGENALPDLYTLEQVELHYRQKAIDGNPPIKLSMLRALAKEGKLRTIMPGREYLTKKEWFEEDLGLGLKEVKHEKQRPRHLLGAVKP